MRGLRATYNSLLGLTALMGLSAAFLIAAANGAFDPRPYRAVNATFEVDGSDLLLTAHFFKGDCTRYSLNEGGYVIRGFGSGGIDHLRFTDMDDRADNEDRVEGDTTLRHRILGGAAYPRVEVWTRHDCNKRKVDRLFARYEAAE